MPEIVTIVPTLPVVGVTLTTCGWMKNVVLAVATAPDVLPDALIVVVPYFCLSTVKVAVNDPAVVLLVAAPILLLVPNTTVITSFEPYPVPLTVTIVPTLPIVGVTL